MRGAGILTVGDELLAGEIDNTNATWIAERLTRRGATVGEVRVVPDDETHIADAVGELAARFDSLVVTGGLGSTPDDVTLPAVADALDRPLEPNPEARRRVESAVADIREEYPDFRHDVDAAALVPAGATVLPNDEGISPGCRCENVYVVPGIPDEMKAVFRRVETEFDGAARSRTLYSETAESHLSPVLTEAESTFDVRVGCYPTGGRKRIRLVSRDEDALSTAREWLLDRPDVYSATTETQPESDDR